MDDAYENECKSVFLQMVNRKIYRENDNAGPIFVINEKDAFSLAQEEIMLNHSVPIEVGGLARRSSRPGLTFNFRKFNLA